MSITVTNPTTPETSQPKGNPGQQKQKPNPAKEMEKKRLQRQQEQITKRLERLSVSNQLRTLAGVLIQAQDNPNDDPRDLFAQVRPLLTKMGIANISDAGNTKLQIGSTDAKGNSLYTILLRRTASISTDIIDRIKRNEANLKEILWTSKGMEVNVWWPYTAAAAPSV